MHLESYNVESIQYMLEWVLAFDVHLNVIHVTLSYSDQIPSEKELEKWKQQFHKEIADWRLTFHLLNGDEEGIKNFVEEINADLICLSTHIRGFWTHLLEPNISKDIARKVDIPVLVVKPT